MRKYQVWVVDGHLDRMVCDVTTLDRADDFCDDCKKEGYATFITYTEPEAPGLYKRLESEV